MKKSLEDWNKWEADQDSAIIGSILSAGAVVFALYLCLILTGCATTSRVITPDGKVFTSQESTTFLGWGTDYSSLEKEK